jgi:glycine/D-amino acid oxidase-like deaminating enzyme
MTTNMITAARLLAHKTVNGRYQSLLALDGFPVLGHQMVSDSVYACGYVLDGLLMGPADTLNRLVHY